MFSLASGLAELVPLCNGIELMIPQGEYFYLHFLHCMEIYLYFAGAPALGTR